MDQPFDLVQRDPWINRLACDTALVLQAAHAEDPGGQSEDEPEVLDLENPNFHIRPHDEMPAGPVPQDQIDRLEFAADERRQPAQHDW